jgi:DNA-binding NarL/FixJ family response regulator
MHTPISVLIAEPNYLVRRGLESLLSEHPEFILQKSVWREEEVLQALRIKPAAVLITNYNHFREGSEWLRRIHKTAPSTRVLVIADPLSKQEIDKALEYGAFSYLLSECESEEILQAIVSTARDAHFFCGKIVNLMNGDADLETLAASASCAGLNISEREIEIIRHVSEGFSNKEIADKLFLSTHTVTTHRKNIMNKLQVNNTAGLVLFAVRNNLLGPNKFLFS